GPPLRLSNTREGWYAFAATSETGVIASEQALLQKKLKGEVAQQVALYRDIFGNPFRAVTLDPSWLTATVLTLAAGIYADRPFDRLPILADALQDAGCGNADVLDHCRSNSPHARGCWVVDLVLNKR